jgi:prevent-host-death family protein
MKVSAQDAEEHISHLLEAAGNGEEVEISVPGKRALRLVPVEPAEPVVSSPRTGRRILGAGRGEIRSISDEEWRQMKQDLERLMNDAPLLSSGEV